MKSFIKKITVLFLFVIVIYVSLGFLADGYTDAFYSRFTVPKQSSLIIGTSRVAQGIHPSVLNEKLDATKYQLPVYNFGFTILDSPYGKTYYNLIVNKLKENTNNGIFILDINPWGLSSRKELKKPRESERQISKITYTSLNPNYDYLRNGYKGTMFGLIYKKIKRDTTLFLNENGRLLVNVDMSSSEVSRRTVGKIKTYKRNREEFKFSLKRLEWLKKTVSFLSKKGKVIFVRMPINKEILELENSLIPNFDELIVDSFPNVTYLNYKNQREGLVFIDGNHLYKKSGKGFTELLAKDIERISKNE